MGFDRHWLALREPADRKARDWRLLSLVKAAIEGRPAANVLDIGCGTGSTYRSINPHLDQPTRWTLLDNDQDLLDEVGRLHGAEVDCVRMDLNAIGTLPLQGVSMVTASALFDLCSQGFIEDFCSRLSEADAGLYAALNYDGMTAWSDAHSLDETVIAAFNAHQCSDKGFGLSLGPDAWRLLEQAMRRHGYDVQVAESPWVLGEDETDLHIALLQGIAAAVGEYGLLDQRELAAWHAHRHRSALAGTGLCQVGHHDLVALR